MGFVEDWAVTRRFEDEYRNKNSKGSWKGMGLRWTLDETPVRIHLMAPEKRYQDMAGKLYDFRIGHRYYIKFAGKNGVYLEDWEKSIVRVYKNPAKFGLDIPPIQKFDKVDPKVYISVAAWIEEDFHLVEKKTQDGERTYHTRLLCTKIGCEHCKARAPKVFGKKVFLVFNKNQWDNEILNLALKLDAQCKCGGYIYTSHYECPDCHTELVNVANKCYSCSGSNISLIPDQSEAHCEDCGATWSLDLTDNADTLNTIRSGYAMCPSCHDEKLIKRVSYCTNPECDKDPYGLFDCQMKVKVTKDGASTFPKLNIMSFSIQEPDPRLFDPKFQGASAEDAEKAAKFMAAPVDLDKILEHRSSEEEAKLLNLPNPFDHQPVSGYAQYNRSPDPGEQEGYLEEPEVVPSGVMARREEPSKKMFVRR